MKTSDYRVLSTHTVKQIYHIILISNQKLSDLDKYKNVSHQWTQTQCITELFLYIYLQYRNYTRLKTLTMTEEKHKWEFEKSQEYRRSTAKLRSIIEYKPIFLNAQVMIISKLRKHTTIASWANIISSRMIRFMSF